MHRLSLFFFCVALSWYCWYIFFFRVGGGICLSLRRGYTYEYAAAFFLESDFLSPSQFTRDIATIRKEVRRGKAKWRGMPRGKPTPEDRARFPAAGGNRGAMPRGWVRSGSRTGEKNRDRWEAVTRRVLSSSYGSRDRLPLTSFCIQRIASLPPFSSVHP